MAETEYLNRFTPRWIIESAYFIDGYVSFLYRGRSVEHVKVTQLLESGFRLESTDGVVDVDWDSVENACYHQPVRRIGEIRGPGDVTWIDDEAEWPCEHCRVGDHVPCPAPAGNLGLCCCDDAPWQMTLEYVDSMRDLGMIPFQGEAVEQMLEQARSRGWTRRY